MMEQHNTSSGAGEQVGTQICSALSPSFRQEEEEALYSPSAVCTQIELAALRHRS